MSDMFDAADIAMAQDAMEQNQAEQGLREQFESDDANVELSTNLRSILRGVRTCEGIGEIEFKTLCFACGIDPTTL
jgi:hypothetical protein